MNGALLIRRKELVTGLPLLRAASDELRTTGYVLRYTGLLGVLAEGLGSAGQVGQGLTVIGDALARSERSDGRWCMAELLRIKGELMLQLAGDRSIPEAEACLLGAIDVAQEQGALFWELRAATSLARLWRDQGRSVDATALLQPVYDQFTEGFGTADLKAAKALLDDLE